MLCRLTATASVPVPRTPRPSPSFSYAIVSLFCVTFQCLLLMCPVSSLGMWALAYIWQRLCPLVGHMSPVVRLIFGNQFRTSLLMLLSWVVTATLHISQVLTKSFKTEQTPQVGPGQQVIDLLGIISPNSPLCEKSKRHRQKELFGES